jgi:hypothetical protein
MTQARTLVSERLPGPSFDWHEPMLVDTPHRLAPPKAFVDTPQHRGFPDSLPLYPPLTHPDSAQGRS